MDCLDLKMKPFLLCTSYNPDGVVYLGSFSKMFAPGFRIGWAVAPHAIRDKLVLASESAILSPSMVGQMAISSYLEDFDWYAQIEKFRIMYKERADAMLKALNDYMPNCTGQFLKVGYAWVRFLMVLMLSRCYLWL